MKNNGATGSVILVLGGGSNEGYYLVVPDIAVQYQVVPEVLQRHTKLYLGAVVALHRGVLFLDEADDIC